MWCGLYGSELRWLYLVGVFVAVMYLLGSCGGYVSCVGLPVCSVGVEGVCSGQPSRCVTVYYVTGKERDCLPDEERMLYFCLLIYNMRSDK
jgi:hypothetical protein